MAAGQGTRFCVTVLVLSVAASPLAGVETTIQNDSLATPTAGTPCQCFLAGEKVAAWLTAPRNGNIVAVQVGWASPFGGNPSSQEMSVTVLASGTFPTPGSPLINQDGSNAVVLGPILQDGQLNEFRHLDLAQTIPLSVPVTAGQSFVVALEYLNQTSGNAFASDVVWDNDGCQAGKNSVFVMPGGWTDACPQGVAGDWMIRAVIDCPVETCPAVTRPGLAALAGLILVAGTALARRNSRRCET